MICICHISQCPMFVRMLGRQGDLSRSSPLHKVFCSFHRHPDNRTCSHFKVSCGALQSGIRCAVTTRLTKRVCSKRYQRLTACVGATGTPLSEAATAWQSRMPQNSCWLSWWVSLVLDAAHVYPSVLLCRCWGHSQHDHTFLHVFPCRCHTEQHVSCCSSISHQPQVGLMV